MLDERRQDVERVRLDDQLVVIGAEFLRHLAGVRQLVEVALAEADRERLHRRRAQLGHLGDDRARIHAAAQKGAERDVGDQAAAHGIAEQVGEARQGIVFRQR